MHGARLGRIVRRTGGWAMAFAAVFGAVLVAASSARAHGGVSIGIGFGFPAFVGAPIYAPPVFYVPPPVYYSPPYVGYYGPPPLYRRHYHRYAIIVIAAVAIDLAMNAMVWRSSAQGDDIERVIGRGDRHGEMFQP